MVLTQDYITDDTTDVLFIKFSFDGYDCEIPILETDTEEEIQVKIAAFKELTTMTYE